MDLSLMHGGICNSYCEHGGRCTLTHGHEGDHDSGFCQWTDEQALTKEQADAKLSGNPLAIAFFRMFT